MTDATEKHNWLIYFFWESRRFFPLHMNIFPPCVVVSPMFERRFCSGGLCFLTRGSGVFRCWLWIISCNDGSAWHVCLDSTPSSWNTDQTELSFSLTWDWERHFYEYTITFTHAHTETHCPSPPKWQQNQFISLAPSSCIEQWWNFRMLTSFDQGTALFLSYHLLAGQVKGDRSQMAACILSSSLLWLWPLSLP